MTADPRADWDRHWWDRVEHQPRYDQAVAVEPEPATEPEPAPDEPETP